MIQSSVLPIDFFMVLKIKPGVGFREMPDSQREMGFPCTTRTPKILPNFTHEPTRNAERSFTKSYILPLAF